MRALVRSVSWLLLGLSFAACKPAQNIIQLPSVDAGKRRDGGVFVAPDAAPPDGGLTERTWNRDVAPIVHQRCILCHGPVPNFGATRSIYTYADTQAITGGGQPVHDLMVFRIYAASQPMPPADQFTNMITPEERTIVREWSLQGAPEGEPEPDGGVETFPDAEPDGGVPIDGGEVPDAGINMLQMRAHAAGGGPFPFPTAGADTDYVCWAYTIPPGTPTEQYAIEFRTHLGVNTQHVHHLLIFHNQQINAPVDTTQPFSCPGFSVSWNLLSGWFPGRPDEHLPANVGVRLRPGEQLILQAHYDQIPPGSGLSDDSGMDALITYQRGLLSAGNLWSGAVFGLINGADQVIQATCTLTDTINVFSVFPHMHQTGTRISLEREMPRNSGTWVTVVEIPAWTFGTQPIFPVSPPLQLTPGDRIRTTCHYNTQGQVISWGEGSTQEMCFNFMFHYPLVRDTQYCVENQQ